MLDKISKAWKNSYYKNRGLSRIFHTVRIASLVQVRGELQKFKAKSIMASRKASVHVAFILAALAILFVSAESHNLIVGEREYGDDSIYRENIAEKYDWTGQKVIVTRNITAPYNYYITQVRCMDEATDGTGAEPAVTGGGPKGSWVNMRFKSQRWHGIYFRVEVFGKRKY